MAGLGGCVIPVPVPETVYSPCHAIASGAWRAEIESYLTAHGKPLTRYNLVVSGEVTVPTGGFRVWLEEGPVQEIEPRTLQILVRTDPPAEAATQAVVTHQVRGAFPARKRIDQISLRCGDGTLALVPVEPRPR
ncbi:MAG: hypothetical protein ACK40O_02765 [Allosphingosinicella sp.]